MYSMIRNIYLLCIFCHCVTAVAAGSMAGFPWSVKAA